MLKNSLAPNWDDRRVELGHSLELCAWKFELQPRTRPSDTFATDIDSGAREDAGKVFESRHHNSPPHASRFDENGGADFDKFKQQLGVPIGEAEAAVRFGAAHVLGARGAVDAVAGAVEADPHGADGVVRTGWKREFAADLLGFLRLGKNFRIEKISWIWRGADDVEFADGALLGEVRDAAREVRDEVGARVVNLELPLREEDADVGGFLARGGEGDVGHLQFRAGGYGAPVDVGVQLADETGMRMKFFRDEFERVFVIEPGLLGLGDPSVAERLEARDVFGGEDVAGVKGHVECEAGLRGVVEVAGLREIFEALKILNGGAGLRANLPVDGAGGNAASREGDLGFEGLAGGVGFGRAVVGRQRNGRRNRRRSL